MGKGFRWLLIIGIYLRMILYSNNKFVDDKLRQVQQTQMERYRQILIYLICVWDQAQAVLQKIQQL